MTPRSLAATGPVHLRGEVALGVLTALGVVEDLNARGERLPCAIEVLGFADEEGLRYQTSYLGSLSAPGQAPPDWLDRATFVAAHRRLVLEHLGRFREVPRGQRLRFIPTWLLPTANRRRLLLASVKAAITRAVAPSRPRKVRP